MGAQMKLIIAGTRTLNVRMTLLNSLICTYELDTQITEIVSGGAQGVDKAGELLHKEWSDLCGPDAVKLTKFPADWEKHGKSAGHIRNALMANYADALLLIWDGKPGKSPGSSNMRHRMLALKKPVYEVIL